MLSLESRPSHRITVMQSPVADMEPRLRGRELSFVRLTRSVGVDLSVDVCWRSFEKRESAGRLEHGFVRRRELGELERRQERTTDSQDDCTSLGIAQILMAVAASLLGLR